MSLHIGNLSSHIHMGELERVFRRFGRCSIRVKDKYGFVVYDYPASAEKALKTLRGTRICGEALTLSWSKHQPHAMQRFGPAGRPFKQPYRKYPVQENAGQRLGSNSRRDYEMDFRKADEGRAIGSSDLVDESISYHRDDVEGYGGEREHSYANNHHGFERNHLEDDRWGDQILDPSHESYLENDIEFDRYDPCHSVGIQELDEHQTTSPLAGSPTSRKSKERTGNFYHTKSQKNCYLCGKAGHKMRNCPLELKRPVPRSHGRMGPEGDTVGLRYRESDGEPSTFRNRLEHGDSSQLQISPSGRKKEFRNKNGNRRDYESTDKDHIEKAGGPSPSSFHSGHTSSRVRSRSKKNSLSSSLKSSPSRHSESKPFKTPYVSPSTSSASLPLDLNRHPSPSNKVQTESKDSVANAGGNLFEDETLVRSGTGTSKSENIGYTVEYDSGTMKDSSVKDNDPYNPVSKGSLEMFDSYAPQLDSDDHFGDKLVEEHVPASESDSPVKPNASNSAKISLAEICMVLKHYGLQPPDENEKDLPVESYFGCARLWPWELIYYRRLKKGSISAENYSRRIAQNEKFGIVDKYVRCSSDGAN